MFDIDGNVEYDIDNICRTCLNYNDDMKSIFHINENKDVTPLHEIIMTCTQIQISKDDGMPYKICNSCRTKVHSAYDYKKTCEASDSKLRKYIERKCSEVNIKVEDDFKNEINQEVSVDEDPINEVLLKNLNKYSINVDLKENEIDIDDTKNFNFYIEHHEENVVSLKTEYICEVCNEKFDYHQELQTHMLVHNVGKSGNKRGRPSKEELSNLYDAFYCLGSPNEAKSCICKICNETFHKISKLREHLSWHTNDLQSFSDINLKSKLEFFENTKINIALETNENLISFVQYQLNTKNNCRFYQILNNNSWELSLSDSETESDEEISFSEWKSPHREHICSKCNKSFDRLHKIICHIKHEHENSDFNHKCQHCNKIYPNNIILKKHLRSQCENTMKKVCCNVCKVKFMWKSSCEAHANKMHIKGSPFKGKQVKKKSKHRTFVCNICSKTFYRGEHLDRHRKIHMPAEKKFSCDICQKKCNRKDNLRSHMRVHKEDKDKQPVYSHSCIFCERSFSNSSNLIVHMRRHTGERPYKCEVCDKGFRGSSQLQCHRRTHTGEKPCVCTTCGKGFSSSYNLARHVRIHTGDRPYKCTSTFCDKTFVQSNDLTLHIRRHTGDKPYVCGICGDRFIQSSALQTHRRTQGHYGEVNQPTSFASLNVNNPNGIKNVSLVNPKQEYTTSLSHE